MTRIIIGDPSPITRKGLCNYLEQVDHLIVVGEAGLGLDLECLCMERSPDILIMNIGQLNSSLGYTIRSIKKRNPNVNIIIYTDVYGNARQIVEMGVVGYVMKDDPPEALIHVIHDIQEGGSWFSRRVIDEIINTRPNLEVKMENSGLTNREWEIVQWIARGCTNQQIAINLFITEGTVKNHIVNIYQKLDIHSRAGIVSWFWEND